MSAAEDRGGGDLASQDAEGRPSRAALKFLTPRNFERGASLLLDYGAVTALPNLVVIGSADQIREASQQLYLAGIRFMTKSNLPRVLTREQAASLAEMDGWQSPTPLTAVPPSRSARTLVTRLGDKIR